MCVCAERVSKDDRGGALLILICHASHNILGFQAMNVRTSSQPVKLPEVSAPKIDEGLCMCYKY